MLATLDLDGVVPFDEELIDLAWQRRRRGTSRGASRGGGFTFRSERPVRQFVTYFSRGAGRRTFETGLRRSGLSLAKLRRLPHGVVLDEHIATGVLKRKLRTPGKRLQLAPPEISAELRREFKGYALERDLDASELFALVWSFYREKNG